MIKAITGDEEGREITGKDIMSFAWRVLGKTAQTYTVSLEG